MKVHVVRTPAGNFGRLTRGLERAGARVEVRSPRAFTGSETAIVLAGVSSFGTISRSLAPARRHLIDHVRRELPLLGVCAGLQAMFERSEEGGGEGLAIFPGTVRILRDARLPHLGWSRLERRRTPSVLLRDVPDGAYAYFAHSYRAPPMRSGPVVAAARYGREVYPAAVEQGNVWGVQFHPEVSGSVGATVLRNWVDFARQEGR